PRVARFASIDGSDTSDTMRSILFFAAEPEAGEPGVYAGNQAIAQYLLSGANGRLIQSLKSFLADRLFRDTNIMGNMYSLEDLITPILVALSRPAVEQFGEVPERIVVGRPVRFSAARTKEDDDLATARLEVALRRAGFRNVIFEYEPVAAAYHYASTIATDELILVADFGGGTSDFSIVRICPRTSSQQRYDILANDGVAIAGDAFDGEIVRHLVASELGRGSRYKTPYGQVLPMPTSFYAQLERWHYFSFLKARATMERLRDLERQALEPEKIRALVHIVENDLGYMLFRSIERTKIGLSESEETAFTFSDPPIAISKPVRRKAFETWIERELNEIAGCVDRVMEAAGAVPTDIDTVFMTGGSSFVPAVREIFLSRFGAEKLRMGNEFTSVARGLALRALELE
ncbi:MAG TPA: Hsp70 family protein, partial [Candidatus Binataceae bacterium]|nr:Hsp70 family protein [Candidatus Binataceae bacterium]